MTPSISQQSVALNGIIQNENWFADGLENVAPKYLWGPFRSPDSAASSAIRVFTAASWKAYYWSQAILTRRQQVFFAQKKTQFQPAQTIYSQ